VEEKKFSDFQKLRFSYLLLKSFNGSDLDVLLMVGMRQAEYKA